MVGIGGDQRRTLQDFVTTAFQGISSSIAQLTIEANNFGLKPGLLSMREQSQFGITPLKDPNLHLSAFIEVYDTLKLNGVSTDAINLGLFPFSLRDKVRAWLHSFPPRCIMT